MRRRAAVPRVAPVSDPDKRREATWMLAAELQRLGCGDLDYTLCFSDADWRRTMLELGCPVYNARLESPTARRGTRGKLGMATICHFKHEHPAVVYVRTNQRPWDDVMETVRHEALHLARPNLDHRRLHTALEQSQPLAHPFLQLSFNI